MKRYDIKLDKLCGFRNKFIYSNNGIQERDIYEIEPIKDRRTQVHCWHLSYPRTFIGISTTPIEIITYTTAMVVIAPLVLNNGVNVNVTYPGGGSWCKDSVKFLLQNNAGDSIIEVGMDIGYILFNDDVS